MRNSFIYRIQRRNVPSNDRKRGSSSVGRSSWSFLHGSSYDCCACLYCKVNGRSAFTIYSNYCKVLSAIRAPYNCVWLTRRCGGDDSVQLHSLLAEPYGCQPFPHTLPEANQDKVRIFRSVLCAPTQLESIHPFSLLFSSSTGTVMGSYPSYKLSPVNHNTRRYD